MTNGFGHKKSIAKDGTVKQTSKNSEKVDLAKEKSEKASEKKSE